MPRQSQTLHDIAVTKVTETRLAILFDDGDKKVWVPKSLTQDDGFIQIEENKDGSYTLTAPEWWLKDRGLI